jgi:hypothetical protein
MCSKKVTSKKSGKNYLNRSRVGLCRIDLSTIVDQFFALKIGWWYSQGKAAVLKKFEKIWF